jgi:hypothetical protein
MGHCSAVAIEVASYPSPPFFQLPRSNTTEEVDSFGSSRHRRELNYSHRKSPTAEIDGGSTPSGGMLLIALIR